MQDNQYEVLLTAIRMANDHAAESMLRAFMAQKVQEQMLEKFAAAAISGIYAGDVVMKAMSQSAKEVGMPLARAIAEMAFETAEAAMKISRSREE